MRIGRDMVTMAIIDGVEAAHASEALEFMGLKKTDQRIAKIRNGGAFQEGNDFYVIPYPDSQGRLQKTTFITLLALTAFVLRSKLAVKSGSNANVFANALIAKISQPRAHKAEMLIQALAPGIEHFTKASTRLVHRHRDRSEAAEAENRSLREQLAQAHQALDEAREHASHGRCHRHAKRWALFKRAHLFAGQA